MITSQAELPMPVNGSAAWLLVRSLQPLCFSIALPLAAHTGTCCWPLHLCQSLSLWHPRVLWQCCETLQGLSLSSQSDLFNPQCLMGVYPGLQRTWVLRASPGSALVPLEPSCPGCSSSQPAQRLCAPCRSGASCRARWTPGLASSYSGYHRSPPPLASFTCPT